MDGGVAIPNMPPQGFFQLPRPQVPHFQRPRFHPPFQNMPQPNLTAQSSSASTSDTQTTTTQASSTINTIQMSGSDLASLQFDGKRMRKAVVRKTVDYNTSVVKYLQNRIWQRDHRDARVVQPDSLYQLDMVPPAHYKQKPMNCLTTKFMRQSTNKFRCPIFCLAWTPEGRRLVTGASSGEFTLWNGLTFSFETILQAHETSVRAMVWSHNDQWMVTGDHAGFIKYWQSNMNNVKMYQGHKEAIRGISLCPTDSKFASCSDDGTVRVWDFMRCYEEKILRGHGADVKCVDWHPQKSLIASGSKDNQVPVKLWDPKSGQSLATLHAHKFTVMDISWNQNGNWLLTAARDHLIKLFDIRNLKEELQIFKGHKKEATAVAWHPINEQMFASGGSDGAIMFWNAGTDKEVGAMEEAHDAIIWDLAWHPLGHVLVSGSNDHSTKFWTRNRPGDAMRDKYNLNIVVTGPDGEALDIDHDMPLGEAKSLLPGMGLEHGLPPPEEEEPEKTGNEEEELPAIPGLDWSADAQFFKDQLRGDDRPRKKTPYARPIPRSFEQAWITNQQPGTLVKEDGQMKRGKIQSLLTLELPDRPPPGLEYVDYDGNDSDVIRKPVDFNVPGQGFNPGLPGMMPPSVGLLPIPNPLNMMPNPDMMPNPGVPTPFGNDIDHRPKMGPGDQDYRSDQDYRQDQDLRADSDYRGNDSKYYRNNDHENFGNDERNQMMQGNESGGPFRGDGPSPMKSGNFRGGASNRGSGRNQSPMGNFQDNRNDRSMNDSYDMDDGYDNYDDYGPSDMYGDNQGYEEDYLLNDSRQQSDWNMGYDQDDRMDYDQRRRSPSPNQSFNRNQGRDRKQSDRNRGGFKDRGRGGRGGDRGGFRGRGSGNRGSQQNMGDRGGRMDTGGWNDSGPQSDRDFDGNDKDFRSGRFNDSSERGGRNERGGRGNYRGGDRGGRGGDRGGRGGDRGGRGGDHGARGGDRGGRGGRGGKRGRGNEHRGGRRGGRGGRGGN